MTLRNTIWAYDSDPGTPTAKLLLIYLATAADADGVVHTLRHERAAEWCQTTPYEILLALADLSEAGLISQPGDDWLLSTPPDPEQRRPEPREPRRRGCRVCHGGRRQPTDDTVTYIAQREGWYKIGRVTGDVAARMRGLATPRSVVCPDEMDETQPVTLVGTLPGDVEHELHERFAAAHVRGEWFRAEPIRDAVAACLAAGQA